jgi:predicted aldo/keto reductase-like oxidoreductase
MAGFEPRVLGRTGLRVGPLGVSGGYGAPAEAFEEAFERGCNYFYWGSKRRDGMARAIRNIVARGDRDKLVVLLQSYSRFPGLMESFLIKGLKSLGIERADVLLLGWYNKTPSPRILERALSLKNRGLVRFLAVSGHNREAFPKMAATGVFDILHVRYNAAHRGAEQEVFPHLPEEDPPGVVTYTATRWGNLLNPKKTPKDEPPLSAAECYRFVLSNPAVGVCISGPKNKDQMDQALTSLEAGPLSPEEMERARRIGDYVHK